MYAALHTMQRAPGARIVAVVFDCVLPCFGWCVNRWGHAISLASSATWGSASRTKEPHHTCCFCKLVIRFEVKQGSDEPSASVCIAHTADATLHVGLHVEVPCHFDHLETCSMRHANSPCFPIFQASHGERHFRWKAARKPACCRKLRKAMERCRTGLQHPCFAANKNANLLSLKRGAALQYSVY